MLEILAWGIIGFLTGLAVALLVGEIRRRIRHARIEQEWIEARKQERFRKQQGG